MLALWLHHALLFAGVAALLVAERRNAGFRAAAFGEDTPRFARNWSFFGSAVLVASALRALAPVLREIVPGLGPWGRSGLGLVLNVTLCFLTAELVGWLLHYIKHRSTFLWRFHFQHHLETRFDPWLVTHTHGLEVLVSGVLLGSVLVALGFQAGSVQAYFLFYALANTWQHSSRNLTLGPLDAIIVSPAYHRLHHAVRPEGVRCVNFGNTLTVWDRIFRTARFPSNRIQPDVPVGIPAGPEPFGFWSEMAWFLEGIRIRKVRRVSAKRPTDF